MTSVYIAIGVIVGSLCLTAAVLYFISPSKRERRIPVILPAILLLATLTFYPVGYGIYLSFTDESAENYGQGEFVGLDNYETLFSDERDYDGDVTLVLENLHIHASLDFRLCGNAHAVGRHVRYVTRKRHHRKGRMANYPTHPGRAGLYFCDHVEGNAEQVRLVNGILTSDIDYLGLDNWAKFSVIFVNIWMGFSFMTMTTSGALAGIEGHVRGRQHRWRWKVSSISPPDIATTHASLGPIVTLGHDLDLQFVPRNIPETGGGPDRFYGEPGVTDILVTFVYDVAFIDGEYGLGAAWSVVIFLMLIVQHRVSRGY